MKYLIASLLGGLLTLPVAMAQDGSSVFEPLTIERQSGDTISLRVEMADEPDEIALGLMFRESIDDDEGMLFDFGEVREANMYMKNVPISLDMLFVNEEGEVRAIARHATPQSLRIINPGFPVAGVLEIGGGRAEAMGIEIGDTLIHDMFENVGADEDVTEGASSE